MHDVVEYFNASTFVRLEVCLNWSNWSCLVISDEDRNLVRGTEINYIYVDGVMEIIWCSDFVC